MNNVKNTTETPTESILTPEEAAKYLKVKKDWLLKAFNKGIVPGKRISYKVVRFNRDELDEFIKTNGK